MKKIKFKMPAFSLAEALITLLIVCLITLSSIPVLTKKKRSVTDGAHGKWACTYHSKGYLVSWSSDSPQGDFDKPDDWKPGCNFVPPQNAGSFNITAIGAGGNGANGESKLEFVKEIKAGESTLYGTDIEDGALYRIVVVGGGGGAGGASWRDKCNSKGQCWCSANSNKCGQGGAGGAGGYVIADVNLYSSKNYTLSAGSGGDVKTGYYSTKSDRRAGHGAGSSFVSNSDSSLQIVAPGGQGGVAISLRGKGASEDKCKGGGSGAGGHAGTYVAGYEMKGFPRPIFKKSTAPMVVVNGVNKTSDANIAVAVGKGGNGQAGGCGFMGARSGGSMPNFSDLSVSLPSGIGNGGSSYSVSRGNTGGSGTSGGSGYVALYKIVRVQGSGGKAAEPDDMMVMSLKRGKLNIKSIGKSLSKEDMISLEPNATKRDNAYIEARTTTVTVGDSNGIKVKTLSSFPGEDGIQFSGNAPTNGNNSRWTYDGGGAAASGVCKKDSKRTPVYDNNTASQEGQVCKKVECVVDDEEGFPSGYNVGNASGSNEIAESVAPFVYSGTSYPAISEYEEYVKKLSTTYFKTYFSNGIGGIDAAKIRNASDSYFSNDDTDLQGYENYSEIAKNSSGQSYSIIKNQNNRCFVDTANKLKYSLSCTDAEMVELLKGAATIIGYKDTYTCEPAKNADTKAFGAGGGGGYASTHPGFASKGGKGAPGVVIIEW